MNIQTLTSYVRYVSLAAFVSVSYLASAQENFIPGYIITSKGDSISGYLDYRGWTKNPKTIRFKQQADAEAVVYPPSTIDRFGVADEVYVKGAVEIETSARSVNRLTEGAQYQTIEEAVFLLILVDGEKPLYVLKTTAYPDQFYIKGKTGGYDLLRYRKYLVNGRNVAESKGYIQQLKDYLTGCPTIPALIDRSSYQINSIQRIFKTYYTCVGSAATFQGPTSQSKVTYGVIAGASHNALSISGDDGPPDYLLNADFKSMVSFSAGGFIDIKLPKKLNRWSFYNDLTINPSSFSGFYQDYSADELYINYTTTLRFTYLKLSTMIRYQHPLGETASLFVNAGMINGASVTSTVETERFSKSYSTETTTTIPALNSYRKLEQGLAGGLGATFGKFGVEARYERGNGFSSMRGLKTANSRFFALLSYRL